jgi:hypothetical protein
MPTPKFFKSGIKVLYALPEYATTLGMLLEYATIQGMLLPIKKIF